MRIPTIVWVCIVITIVTHLPFGTGIAVFDEPGYFEGVYNTYANRLDPFIQFNGYKPPVTVWFPALLSAAFGPSRIWARLFIIILACISLLLTHEISRKLFSARTAVIATVLLCFFPVFYIQTYLLSDALPLTVGFLAVVYFALSGNPAGFVLGAIWMLLTKETSVLAYAIIGAYFGYSAKHLPLRTRLVSLTVPMFVFIGWLMWNRQVFGWYVWPMSGSKASTMFEFSSTHVLLALENIRGVFLKPYIVLMSLLNVSGLVHMIRHPSGVPVPARQVVGLGVVLGAPYLYAFSSVGLEIRYLLFLLPVFIMFTSYQLSRIYRNNPLLGMMLITGILSLYVFWHGYALVEKGEYHPESSYEFLWYRDITTRTQRYIGDTYPDAVVVSAWPVIEAWREPFRMQEAQVNNGILCPTESTDWEMFWQTYDPMTTEYLFVTSPGVGPHDCDFRTLRTSLLREIHTGYPVPYKDTIRVYRLLQP